jgi:alpha-glucosidase (family GH31 glycosyl hydrolase)
MNRELSNNYNLVYLRISNALNIQKSTNQLNFKIRGGVLDFQIFLGDKYPNKLVSNFHEYLGRYKIPLYWSLGNHFYLRNFQSLDQLNAIVNKIKMNLGLDMLWLD